MNILIIGFGNVGSIDILSRTKIKKYLFVMIKIAREYEIYANSFNLKKIKGQK